MTRETVKAALLAYRDIEETIQQKIVFADESKSDADAEKYRQEAANLRTVKREIIACINQLPDRQRSAIYYHFIRGRTWVWTSVKCAYSERQIRNIGSQGLDQLAIAFSDNLTLSDFCAQISNHTLI